jgi:transposase-like protein
MKTTLPSRGSGEMIRGRRTATTGCSLVYTTNAIESLNARFRAATRRRGHFPNEQSAMKVLYLAVIERRHNRTNPTGEIFGWKAILNTLAMTYGDRLGLN